MVSEEKKRSTDISFVESKSSYYCYYYYHEGYRYNRIVHHTCVVVQLTVSIPHNMVYTTLCRKKEKGTTKKSPEFAVISVN